LHTLPARAPEYALSIDRPAGALPILHLFGRSMHTLTELPADAPAPAPAAAPQPRTLALIFTGDGREYFRIWVVNLLLTLATFGIYSAWAKVRRLQYFDRNTQLAGASFDFHGNPRA